jgi:hypothetical protein
MIREAKNLIELFRGLFFYTNPIESPAAAEWRDQDRARLRNTPRIDAEAVGRLIGAGLQHRIYEYREGDTPMVLKVSVPTRWLRFPTAQEAQADVDFVFKFFGPYAVVPTEVVAMRDGAYAVKQRRLENLRAITGTDLGNMQVRTQFLEIAQRNRQMIREVGRSLDFLGREGQRKARAALLGFHQTPVIANLVIATQPDGLGALRIIDTDLENYRPGARTLNDLRSALAARLAVACNRFLIKWFFHIDIDNP